MSKNKGYLEERSCYKKQIILWCASVLPILSMIAALFYYQFASYNEIKAIINTAEQDIKAQVSADDLRGSTNRIVGKTDEVIALINSMKDELDKSVKIDDEKNKLLSNKYHIVLLASLIEKSILKGESFTDDLETLKKFPDKKIAKDIAVLAAYSAPKPSKIPAEYLDEKKYPYGPPSHVMRGNADNPDATVPVDFIIAALAEALMNKKDDVSEEQSWSSKIHKFFAKWFSIEKIDAKVDLQDKHGYATIASDLLKNGNLEGAYFMLSKLASNKNLAPVLLELKKLKEARDACRSIKDKVLLDD